MLIKRECSSSGSTATSPLMKEAAATPRRGERCCTPAVYARWGACITVSSLAFPMPSVRRCAGDPGGCQVAERDPRGPQVRMCASATVRRRRRQQPDSTTGVRLLAVRRNAKHHSPVRFDLCHVIIYSGTHQSGLASKATPLRNDSNQSIKVREYA